MEMTLALMSQKGINDREDLANNLSKINSIIDISEEDAGDLIMRARAHWFEDKFMPIVTVESLAKMIGSSEHFFLK